MTDREKLYFEKYKSEYLVLRQGCEIWRKPGYSSLSKKLPKIGYQNAVKKGLIPRYRYISGAYLFKIKDILDFLDNKEMEAKE
ncbi:MAG TPA: hypothetical protein CFH82_06590 [Sulfurospirillum sp. UBA12182]|nr:MAG TPA: hypothetical protein CFH82_06590 [Sulfurospirillum sp. UBA12182]